jgi:ketosteroid isomerase-like protein
MQRPIRMRRNCLNVSVIGDAHQHAKARFVKLASFPHHYQMKPEQLCKTYLDALNEGDLDKVLSLFAPDATVVSPLYGTMPVAPFYRALFADTRRSVTRLLNIFDKSGDGAAVALHFHYTWTLASGKVVAFDCVDVFALAPTRDRFAKLTIIYDTAPLRADFNESHGTRGNE